MNQSSEYINSEFPAIELFKKIGYQYYKVKAEDKREDITEVLLKKRLLTAIKRINPWINDNNRDKAFNRLTAVNGASLMEINQKIWKLIRGGDSLKQVFNGKEAFKPIHFIDYHNPENNDFLVVSQMKYHGRGKNSIPDLVVYINGLPIGVIECKSPTVQNAWDEAFDNLEYYQDNSEKLFHYNQICVGIWGVGGKYGAIHSPQQFYSVFKMPKDDRLNELIESPKYQDKLLYSLFKKERVLDLIRHFVLFELNEGTTIKKLPRYQQIRATNEAVKRLQADKGGVIWHTQGSGKSLAMAYITRKLQAPEYGFDNPTVIIMTDRKDLDRQITTTFQKLGFSNVNQASSVLHLNKLLGNDYGGIITTTLQKFQEKDKSSTVSTDQTELEERTGLKIEKQIKDKKLIKITKKLQGGKWIEVEREEINLEKLSTKKNLYILVDEAHRSHYGFLASFMRTVLPNAKFIAFTGTPISKEEKSTLREFYGGDYIDTYSLKEAVVDGATVELLYDTKIVKLDFFKEKLDRVFEENFSNKSEEKKYKLKQKALQNYKLATERIESICKEIINHFKNKIYKDGHKALIVCDGRKAAIKYQEILHKLKKQGCHSFDSKLVVSLGSPKTDSIAKEHYETLEWNKNNPNDPKPVWVVPLENQKEATDNFKLPFGNEEETEKSGKKKFDNTAFIIVSDMLLTGWDVPIASCLYLDKPLKEHNLLQAIARVNRSKKGKNAGFIVDFYGINENLNKALEIFSEDICRDDILKEISEKLPRLAMKHAKLVDFFKPIGIDRNNKRADYIDVAVRYIEPIKKRDDFKILLKEFNKLINILLPDTRVMKYQTDFKLFNEIKLRAKSAFPDDDGLKISKDESKMLQSMMDEHLKAEGVQDLLKEPLSITDKDFEASIMNDSLDTRVLKMRNNLKYTIKAGIDKNPDFYKPLSQRLDELLKKREERQLTQLELLKYCTKIKDEIISEKKECKQKGFAKERERAVYNTMKTIFSEDEDAENETKRLFNEIKDLLEIIEWKEKNRTKNNIKKKIVHLLLKKLGRSKAKDKAKKILHILINNENA